MTRSKRVDDKDIPLTDEENAIEDAKELLGQALRRESMEVTPFMFKQALTRSGEKRGQVNAIISNPNTGDPVIDQDIKDGWDSANSIKRLDPLTLYVQARLGWTDKDADDLFILAETLRR